MAIDRPTFSESWYRVAALQPRLRSSVHAFRQHFRGRPYHVLQDTASNQYFRLDDAAYHLVGLLDGRRTVAEAWDIANEHLGDRAPTQQEVIELLGQLYSGNLLQSNLPPDAEGMFERYRKRKRREVGGYIMNLLFARIPLIDPENVLDRWAWLLGWVFSWFGFVLWLVILGVGGWHIIGQLDRLVSGAGDMLAWDIETIILLYATFAVLKAIHEFGHGFACKIFGKRNHSGGEVHTMGVMFLVGTPVPYVDASSAWAFRSKWQRAMVGAAGMYVELAVAALAAIVWARTAEGELVNAIAYNTIFIASVSTLLFNANPLLKFDGYYILSDLLEIPNLSQRAKDFLYYLVRRYVFGVKRARTTSRTMSERFWLAFYGIAAFIYRILISVAILLFVADKLFFVGLALALLALVGWVIVPMGKFIGYLFTNHELARTRGRAMLATFGVMAGAVGFIGLVPMPERARIEGVVEGGRHATLHMQAAGFVEKVLPSESRVSADGEPVLQASNPDLETEYRQELAERQATRARLAAASDGEPALRLALRERLQAHDERLELMRQQLRHLTVTAPFAGVWIAPRSDDYYGAYLRQGDPIGMVASADDLRVRAVADQRIASRLNIDVKPGEPVEMRLAGRPKIHRIGRIDRILEAGQERLPSAAMGQSAGGEVLVEAQDPGGTRTVEPFFELHIAPANDNDRWPDLRIGQRVVVRLDMGTRPLAEQWWHSLLQLLQRRFRL